MTRRYWIVLYWPALLGWAWFVISAGVVPGSPLWP